MSDAVSPLSAALADPGTSAGARILHAALVEPRRRGAVLRLATTARGDPPPHRSADRGAAARLGAAGGSPCPAGGSPGGPVRPPRILGAPTGRHPNPPGPPL